MPDHKVIREHRHLQVFGSLLHDPNLWHLNRRSASGAFAVGLFFAFVPVPFQMVLAVAGAIICRVNLPLSAALVWVTNPITMPPIFYFTYRVGTWILGEPAGEFHFELSWDVLSHDMGLIWQPFLLGSLVCGTICAALGYLVIRGWWRWHIVKHLERRKARHCVPRPAPTTIPGPTQSQESTPS